MRRLAPSPTANLPTTASWLLAPGSAAVAFPPAVSHVRDHFSFPSCQSTHAAWARETSEPRTSVRTRSLQQERTGPGTFLCSLFTDAKRGRSFGICSHRRTRGAAQLTHGQRESPPSAQKDRSVTPRDPGSFASSRWPWATWLSGTQKAAGPLTRCSLLYLSLKPHPFSGTLLVTAVALHTRRHRGQPGSSDLRISGPGVWNRGWQPRPAWGRPRVRVRGMWPCAGCDRVRLCPRLRRASAEASHAPERWVPENQVRILEREVGHRGARPAHRLRAPSPCPVPVS